MIGAELTIAGGCNYIDGRWTAVASGETYTKVNPMRSSEIVGTFASSGEEDAEAAVAAAERAFETWAARPHPRELTDRRCEVHVPFGGIRSSGFGPHEQGQAAIEFYTDQARSMSIPEALKTIRWSGMVSLRSKGPADRRIG